MRLTYETIGIMSSLRQLDMIEEFMKSIQAEYRDITTATT